MWPLLAFVVVPDLGADARARAPSCSTRCSWRSCSTSCPASRSTASGTAFVIVIGLAVITDRSSSAAGARRRRLVRPPHGQRSPDGAPKVAAPHRRPRHRVRPARRRRRGRAAAGAALRRRPDAPPLAARRLAPPRRAGRPGGRRRRASASAGSSTARPRTCRRSAGSTRRPARSSCPTGPQSAAAIERAHSDGHGLLAHHGSSYGNLFSGDAERAVLTMSGIARRKEGRFGAGYVGYFSRPEQATRTLISVVVEIARERRAALRAAPPRRRAAGRARLDATPCCAAFTTVVSRDVSVQGVLNDIAEGRAAIYVDLLGYDEVPTTPGPSGPTRSPCCATSTARSVASPARSSGRRGPYHLVVLSDHGQTQGATFQRARRRDAGRARRPAVRRRPRPATPTPSRAGPSRRRGCARPGRRRRGDDADGQGRADRARLGQPRPDHAPRPAPPAAARRDRRRATRR